MTSARLAQRVRHDFSAGDAAKVLKDLEGIPETLPLGERQDPERMQAALVLPANGDYERFRRLVELAHRDWRDLLVGAELAHSDWPEKLDGALGHL